MAPDATLTTTHRLEERKWLGQGRKIEADTIQEVLEQAGQDWTVSKRPIVTISAAPKNEPGCNPKLLNSNGTDHIGNLRHHLESFLRHPNDEKILDKVAAILEETKDSYIPHEFDFSIVRNDTNQPFAVMGNIYECLDNRTCIEMIEPLLDAGKATIERGGMFNDGAQCWIIAKLPGSVRIGPDEYLDEYIKLSWSHDGTEKLSATFILHLPRTNIQFSPKVKKAKTSIEIRHTTNAAKRIEIATELFQTSENYFDKVQEVLGELVSKAWTEDEMTEYLEALLPDPKKVRPDEHGEIKETRKAKTRAEILDIFKEDESELSNTKFAAYTAVVKYCDHHRPVKVALKKKEGKSDAQIEQLRAEGRLQGAWMKSGSGKQMKDRALDIIIK